MCKCDEDSDSEFKTLSPPRCWMQISGGRREFCLLLHPHNMQRTELEDTHSGVTRMSLLARGRSFARRILISRVDDAVSSASGICCPEHHLQQWALVKWPSTRPETVRRRVSKNKISTINYMHVLPRAAYCIQTPPVFCL